MDRGVTSNNLISKFKMKAMVLTWASYDYILVCRVEVSCVASVC